MSAGNVYTGFINGQNIFGEAQGKLGTAGEIASLIPEGKMITGLGLMGRGTQLIYKGLKRVPKNLITMTNGKEARAALGGSKTSLFYTYEAVQKGIPTTFYDNRRLGHIFFPYSRNPAATYGRDKADRKILQGIGLLVGGTSLIVWELIEMFSE